MRVLRTATTVRLIRITRDGAVQLVPELIAITYPAETLAGQAAAELGRVAAEILLDPDAVAVIICERDGSSQLIGSRHPGTPAGWSRFWGIFFGDLANGGRMSEIDEGF